MSKKAKIGLIQLKISNNNKKNIENSIKKIRLAAKKKSKYYLFTRAFFNKLFLPIRKSFKF